MSSTYEAPGQDNMIQHNLSHKAKQTSRTIAYSTGEAPAPQQAVYHAGMVIADRYLMVRELGDGGMGCVWLSHDMRLDTPCALKLINNAIASQPDIRARFEREAKAAAQLRSSHVVQTLDYGVWQGIQYMAMELLEGETLEDRLLRCGRLPAEETVMIATQLARALTKAHAVGLIHRDLKPANIFLVAEDDREVAKVLDFGIVKSPTSLMSHNITKAGVLMGTPQYMSPEQAQGIVEIDYRSDLWSLAVIIFRCITGRLPFDSEALGEMLLHIIVHEIPTPSSMAPDVPPTFDVWWARAAVRDPSKRFQSAKELTDTLAVALGVHLPPSHSVSITQHARAAALDPASIAPNCRMTVERAERAVAPALPRIPVAVETLLEGTGAPPAPMRSMADKHHGSRDNSLQYIRAVGMVLAIIVTGALLTIWSTAFIDRMLLRTNNLSGRTNLAFTPAQPATPAAGPPGTAPQPPIRSPL